ncbi:tetratricopeptide repeat protein [Candidatus Binatus sp.]|uniref:tetratricopeptide repeat protein n=1 Tax=Candidatus Binatus sp. TaxID=2811406 RepID=UPI003BB10D4E
MNRRIFLAVASTLLLIALIGSVGAEPSESATPAAGDLQASIDSVREPIFDGLGSLHHPVTTKTNSILAQRFFDQGLTFVYAFNDDEAAGSFEQAAHLDPEMAMAYWGIALSLGPNINLPEDTDRGKMAYAAISKAKSLEGNASAAEREYIDALANRYAADGRMNDDSQLAYANAMRDVARHNPDDPDAGALFAESMMDLHPWALWTNDGKPVDGTPEIVATLEGVMAKDQDHLGANHYYIHAVEASPDPGSALASAQRLPKLAPAAGHIVHMPSHIYFRVGDYDASATANEAAIKADKIYLRERNPKGIYPMMYVPHNIQFLWASYMMEGNSRGAFRAARDLDTAVPLAMVRQMPMAEFMSPTRYFTEARFSNWDAILKEPPPPADLTFTTGVWHYARGLALAAKNRPDDALAEKKKVDEIIAATPADRIVGFNTADKLLAMGSATLAGEIESAKGNHDGAIEYFKEAVAIQDALNYEEPPPWYYPVRETLGMELLAAGKNADAEQVFRDDLKQNPENGWSLNGLALCLHARNASDEAASVDVRLKKAWAHADVKLPGAVGAVAASN